MLKSLLFLQARISTNEDTKRILEESQARINSMALVHKNLYDDNENGQLNFPIFLESLLSELAASYIDSSRDLELLVEGHCEDLNIELAIPLALMMNELATNSFKYAFQNNGQHLIRIEIQQVDRLLKIRYTDNGPGIAGAFDLSKGGFGFRVLSILSQQINAKISYFKQPGESVFNIELMLTNSAGS
jgi:two-component sensor histidine kinase